MALEGGKSGLVHISEIANTYVNDVHDFLQGGAGRYVLVIATESADLSIKKALPAPERPAQRSFQPLSGSSPRPAAAPRRPAVQAADTTLRRSGLLRTSSSSFFSSSERKMADLNRNISGKQGGRRRR